VKQQSESSSSKVDGALLVRYL